MCKWSKSDVYGKITWVQFEPERNAVGHWDVSKRNGEPKVQAALQSKTVARQLTRYHVSHIVWQIFFYVEWPRAI